MSRDATRERIAQAERDLAEIAEQLELGELDAATAERLTAKYRTERDDLVAELAEEVDEESAPAPSKALSGRFLVGVGGALIVVIGFGLWLIASNTEDTSAAEGIANEIISEEGVNLDDVSNEEMEAVIAENPNIPGMRLALADRYFAAGEFSSALTHYMYVLETLEVKDAAALANVGWMTFLSQVPDVAESFVEESLEVQPDGGIAFWYLANIRYYGLGDAAGAVEPLEQLLAYPNLPDELRAEAEQLLAEVEAAL
jgi:tetratricopeptide (TPR) repeat protein